ncbi:probable phospholipid-transporting ATPase IA isoform X3 [Artemia franciscana]|uniref:Phospholipid-transporting ATPase n=1 Tax=Artemia franciscana TaxID=6661 RepID=A0AA88I4M5_ARTSF|nr:hypothetical protein QYM36_004111 [Artemia franciscana]
MTSRALLWFDRLVPPVEESLARIRNYLPFFRKQTEDDVTSAATDSPQVARHREIGLNRPQPQRYASNRISTAKYNLLTFFPKFLLEQFRKYSNCFFLLIALFQQVPDVSPTGRFTTLVPLLFILAVSAVKEIIEDIKRYRADNHINKRRIEAYRNYQWKYVRWDQVLVGDVVKVWDDHFFPADLLLLSSSEPQCMCYIETANLDGETNLKIRQGLQATIKVVNPNDLREMSATVVCELPNRHLYEFVGNFQETGEQIIPLGPDQILQRGAKLRNTKWIMALVVYTGHETKLLMNSTTAPLKRSTVERIVNLQILLLFFSLLVICLIATIANEIWMRTAGFYHWYLALSESPTITIGHNLLTFIILFNNLIPISLQVTLEVVRFIQASFMNVDLGMYHEDSDTPAMARTSNLNEELGQVKYVFSDKTGTLTRNVMEFKRLSVGGIAYSIEETENPMNSTLIHNLTQGHQTSGHIKEFLTLMAVCHTVIPERDPCNDGKLCYHAASPDERALVYGAQRYGFVFQNRTPEYVVIDALGKTERFEILHVLEFTSDRKRMSVIVRTPNGKLKLYCKGADTAIYPRLKDNQQSKEITLRHLEQFATEGLRTLCCAVVEIPEDIYEDWKATYHKASTALQFREEKIAEAANLIERNLVLLGASAIEDKLQDKVPETIASLLLADIHVWVLTGDKQETAINIGYSCRLLTQGMPLLILNEDTLDGTRETIIRHLTEIGESVGKENDVALIVDGKTLTFALTCEIRKDFLSLCRSSKAVICCRVSPMQKAEVVELVANGTGSVTLAIGDGANDVAMIQKAHIGVGISGVEGLSAACASDYSIAQFKFLARLLFVHGAWNYTRMSKLILYSFYKNICLYVMELWFAMYSGWSGQILFERWTIGFYNLLFTAAPPLAMGLFDRTCSAETMLKYPKLYTPSQTSELFNVRVFWMWIGNALIHSLLLFWLPLFMFSQDIIWSNGRDGGYLVLGNTVYTYVVATVCLKAGFETQAWTWLTHLAIWGSIATWFLFFIIYSNFWPVIPFGANMAGLDRMVFSSATFWAGLLVIPVCCLAGDLAYKALYNTVKKPLYELVRESEIRKSDPSVVLQEPKLTETARLLRNVKSVFRRPSPTSSVRAALEIDLAHGFAFSQEEHGAVPQSEVIRAYDTTRPRLDQSQHPL